MSETWYRYFTNGVFPIRVTIRGSDPGSFAGTETPDKQTGELKLDMRWMSEITWDTSGDIEEITKEEFDAMVEDFVAQKKTDPKPPPDIAGMG